MLTRNVLVLGITALTLDGKSVSRWGNNIVRATLLGPSVFPIVFAGLVGRFMRSIALWRAEHGGKLDASLTLSKTEEFR
jgi:ABC-type sugar transport system permease subunit